MSVDKAKIREAAELPLHSPAYRPPSRKETLALLDELEALEGPGECPVCGEPSEVIPAHCPDCWRKHRDKFRGLEDDLAAASKLIEAQREALEAAVNGWGEMYCTICDDGPYEDMTTPCSSCEYSFRRYETARKDLAAIKELTDHE